MNLAVRSHQPERMDADDLDAATYARVLADLSRVNRMVLAARPTLAFLERAAGHLPHFRLLDVGFGHGDMLRAIARWAARRDIVVELAGVDLNPRSAAIARAATPPTLGISYHSGDYHDCAGPFDFIISSLVLHHMNGQQARDFLAFMEEQARLGWLVNDLHRHRLAHAAWPWLARLMNVHPIVQHDGRLSIARAFHPEECEALLAAAGIPHGAATVMRRFPFRLCIERRR